MYYRFVAPLSFFESPQLPRRCLFSGRIDCLQPADLDLTFTRATPLPSTYNRRPVTDLVTDAQVLQALHGHIRKPNRTLLLTLPTTPGALFQWRLHARILPFLLLGLPPLLAMTTAVNWRTLSQLNWVAAAVLLALALGIALSAGYRRRWPPVLDFARTPHGYVAVTLPESQLDMARQFQIAIQEHLATFAPPSPAAHVPALEQPIANTGRTILPGSLSTTTPTQATGSTASAAIQSQP